MQDIFNLLPNLGVEELARSFAVQSNDMMLAIYLSSLTRSVLALHNLIDNKVCGRSSVRASQSVHSKRNAPNEGGKMSPWAREPASQHDADWHC